MTIRILLLCIAASLSGCAAWQSEPLPATSPDGLSLTENRNFDVLYLRPGNNFSAYKTIFVATPTVEFQKNWQRQQNINDAHRVTDSDVEKIQQKIADQAVATFRTEIAKGTHYQIVDSADAADLVLTPEITGLDIVNPLNNEPYRITVLAEDTGRMTLDADLSDANSEQVLLRFSDKTRGRNLGEFRRQSSVEVLNHTQRRFRAWAKSLNELIAPTVS